MRGERARSGGAIIWNVGSSPHARGTRVLLILGQPRQRFIPACAGNASAARRMAARRTVHPRMRGERSCWIWSMVRTCGSSPHARGTLTNHDNHDHLRRFIPACAGNAGSGYRPCRTTAVHPRMRGERASIHFDSAMCDGSSPHARGTPRSGQQRGRSGAVHPRMRGERS